MQVDISSPVNCLTVMAAILWFVEMIARHHRTSESFHENPYTLFSSSGYLMGLSVVASLKVALMGDGVNIAREIRGSSF